MQSKSGCNATFCTSLPPVLIRVSVLRCFYWLIVSIVLLVCGAVLAARFLLLPQIDRWREPIAAYAGKMTDSEVTIGSISGRWRGWRPRFDFTDVQVRDTTHQSDMPALVVPRLVAELRWRSFIVGEPRFSYLSAQGVELTATWTKGNELRVAGQAIDLAGAQSPAQLGDSPVLQWLRHQGEVTLEDATLHWRNEQRRDAPDLTFEQVTLALRNSDTRHQFSLTATPFEHISGPINVTADIDAALFGNPAMSASEEHGTIYAEVDQVQVERLAPWIDVHQWSGAMSARGWAELVGGKIGEIRTDVSARDLTWRAPDGQRVQGKDLRATFSGAAGNVLPAAWMVPSGGADASEGLNGEVTVQDLTIALPTWFESEPWQAAQASAIGRIVRDPQGGFVATVSQARVQSTDVAATLHGKWTNVTDAPLGRLDLDVQFEHARMSAIHKYLPRTIDGDVRHWLGQALLAGEVRPGTLEVHGPLAAFPYDGQDADAGRFSVEGKIVDATLDYLPEWHKEGHSAAWPRIESLNGRFAIDRTALTILADTGIARLPGHSASVDVGPVVAHIDDMAQDALLVLDGQTRGDVPGYLALLNGSALDGLTDGVFRPMRGSGSVHMPLVLNIPLARASQMALRGEVNFDRADVGLDPKLPQVRQVNGKVIFTRDQVRAVDLKGQWLGGPVAASGVVGAGDRRLTLTGRADMKALREWDEGHSAMLKRFDGELGYRATIAQVAGGGVNVDVSSDLLGLAMDLPAPLGKPARTAMPLRATWRTHGSQARTGALEVVLNQSNRLRIEQGARRDVNAPQIARAAVAIDRPLVLPTAGLRVDVRLDRTDSLPWRDLLGDLDPEPSGESQASARTCAGSGSITAGSPCSTSSTRAMIGPQRDLHLQVGHLVIGRFVLDDLELRARKDSLSEGKGLDWTATLASRQAQGRVGWRGVGHADAGKVVAHLSHLSLEPSDAPEAEREMAAREVADRAVEDISSIPAIDLSVDALTVYERPLGTLMLSGTNLNNGAQWRLDTMRLTNPDADMDMNGMWTARGEDRGLAAVIRLDVRDLGHLLGRLGHPDMVRAGEGTIDARITWRNSPWTHRFKDIDGDLDVDLRKGRLPQVQSNTVKVLELFSLQSLPRIATLKADPTGLAKGGFPFDEIKSHLRLDKGILRVDDYAIDGPVARVKLVGESDVGERTWDMRAEVLPKLDASGAALVVGLVANPVLGAGALLAQWLLRVPLEAALIQRYRLSGPWEDSTIEEIGAPPKEKGTATPRRSAPVIEP